MKIMCIVVSVILLVCFCFSCVDAHAEGSLEWMDVIFQYEDDFRLKLIDVNRKTVEAVNNSNLSDSQKQQALKILAIQELALRTMPDIYGNRTNPIIPDSDTVNFSGSGIGCLYKNANDNTIYPVTINLISDSYLGSSYTFVASNDFIIKGEGLTGIRFRTYLDKNWTSGSWRVGFAMTRPIDFSGSGVWGTYSISGSLADYTDEYNSSTGSRVHYNLIDKNNIPTLNNVSSTGYIGGLGQEVALPTGQALTISPWDYYNNFVLPYITNNFDIDNINQYIAFPNGYYPDSVSPSQQYPTGGGVSIGDLYYFDIDINFPTYPNGEPQTDESGETITETVIVTDTRPTDAVYKFTVPTLPGLQIDSSPIPFNTNISEYTNPLLGFFDLITQIFDASGVLPVIPILFTMGIIFFVIYKCS